MHNRADFRWIFDGQTGVSVMANTREPILQPVPILSLQPTQMTVGMREVKEKRKRWRDHKSKKKQAELLGKHMIPVVSGTGQAPLTWSIIIILALALHDEGVKDILVTIVADLTMVDRDAFWGVLDNRRWVHPYDAKGDADLSGIFRKRWRPQGRSIPQPCRRIAARRRFCEGYDTVQRIPVGRIPAPQNIAKSVEANFEKAIEKALALGKSKDAVYLPGWLRTGVGTIRDGQLLVLTMRDHESPRCPCFETLAIAREEGVNALWVLLSMRLFLFQHLRPHPEGWAAIPICDSGY